MMKNMQNDGLEFGLTIPQGWRGGDLPTGTSIEVDYDSIGQCPFCNSRIDVQFLRM
jgi:hypothetical protein